MLEAVTPARQLDQSAYTYDANGNPVATPIDPTTNQPIYDPNLSPGLSGYQLPLAPGRVLTRIFVGLNSNAVDNGTGLPITPYSNKFEDVRSSTDNRYTLYRADVTAYIQDPTVANPTPSTPYVPNLGLFHTVNAAGVVTDNPNDTLRLHDPNFFYDNSPAGGNAGNSLKWAVKGWVDLNHDGICEIWENWAAVSASLMPKERVDMVALDRASDTNLITYYDAHGDPERKRPAERTHPRGLQTDLRAERHRGADQSGQQRERDAQRPADDLPDAVRPLDASLPGHGLSGGERRGSRQPESAGTLSSDRRLHRRQPDFPYHRAGAGRDSADPSRRTAGCRAAA